MAPRFVEEGLEHLAPRDRALAFAAGKAASVEVAAPALVIGADQTLELDGRVLRKPDDDAATRAQLAELAGREHALHSAIAVRDAATGRVVTDVTTTRLTMRPLTPAQIDAYLARDRPSGAVGGYLYERAGVALFDAVVGSDDSAIVGLPLVPLLRLLRALGVDPLA